MAFYDYQNLRFLLQIFKREEQDSSVFVVADGDNQGKSILHKVGALCKRLNVATHRLPDGFSIEDFCLFEDEFLQAVARTLEAACEFESKKVPDDLEARVRKSWDERKAGLEKAEKRVKVEKPEKDDEKKTAGRWFKDLAKEVMDDEASKVVLARTYAELCREMTSFTVNRAKAKDAKALCHEIAEKLSLPPVRAVKAIELKQS
jgi:hypothetical protein